jgi:hypothetical protein
MLTLRGSGVSVYQFMSGVYNGLAMAHFVRKNITLPARLDARLRKLARSRRSSQSGLIVHLVSVGLATESGEGDPLLRYLGSIEGPSDLSATVDKTVYRPGRPR